MKEEIFSYTKRLEKRLTQDESAPLTLTTALFFIWGFITAMNGILLPKLQEVFKLDQFHTELVNLSFFGAYFLIGILYFVISSVFIDPVLRFGYKKTIIGGLIISAIGCGLFYPAAEQQQYNIFLVALFVLASGIAILQIVANPYSARLGHEETAASLLNLSQAFNSLGTTIAPYAGGLLIHDIGLGTSSVESVKLPYLTLSGVLFLLAILVSMADLPDISYKQVAQKNLLKHRHLILGAIGIFMYVGAEVSIGYHLPQFIKESAFDDEFKSPIGPYLSLYWGGAMIGRFMGAIFMSRALKTSKAGLSIFVLVGAFLLGWAMTSNFEGAFIFACISTLSFLTFLLTKPLASKLLGVFAGIVIILLALVVSTTGYLALWSIIAIGLFNSIIFNNLFALSIQRLGDLTTKASSLLILAIVGGGIMPFAQDLVSDYIGLQDSFLFPMISYLYIMLYAFFWSKVRLQKP